MSAEPRERPILFSGPMVRAILEGRKTQTRRVLKTPQPLEVPIPMPRDPGRWIALTLRGETPEGNRGKVIACRHGSPGDFLWVRETWAPWHDEEGATLEEPWGPVVTYFRADDPDFRPELERDAWGNPFRWRPSIHMPRILSRILLELTAVRVERLQQLSEADALAEGMAPELWRSAGQAYAELWDDLNAARGFGWVTNPLVWVLEFRRVDHL